MLSATFYVTAIILCYTKNIYKICNCKPHPESKFPNEYIGVIFIQIDQHLKKLFKKYKGFPIFLEHGVDGSSVLIGFVDQKAPGPLRARQLFDILM